MNFLTYKSKIICASKYYTVDEMKRIYDLGVTNFGENYVQSLLEKKSKLVDLNISWHLIGHMQSNKVKQIINEIDYLHSLDSIKLVKEIQKYRTKPLNCFIQVNISNESSKSGIKMENIHNFIEEIKSYDKINLIGLMTMGVDDDKIKTEEVFKALDALKNTYNLKYTSMGMSQDFEIALKYNSDFLRIGSLFKGVI